jgi:hypothetical protein
LQQALATRGLPVQLVAFDVGEHASIQVDLVQVARAVVQEVEPPAIGQRLCIFSVERGEDF